MLPLLANTKKNSLQAIDNSFVYIEIYNMTDNRVLTNRPPPINDEETYLTRRQRATLLQLRSDHCKLYNSYKKRLKQNDSSTCADCGMDPQDVSLLFNSISHPTALSHETREYDTRAEPYRPGKPGITTRVVEREYNNNMWY